MGLKLTPAIRVSGPNSEAFNKRAIFVQLTDNPGYSSDSLRFMISADNLTHDIKSGDRITLEWGYLEDKALFHMGLFTITKVKPLYLPTRLEIVATANDFHINSPSKGRRSETYSGVSLADIVRRISARLNLKDNVHPLLRDKFFVHLDQKNESDLSFLQRLAAAYDAVAKTYDGMLIFAPRGAVKNTSGQRLSSTNLIIPKDTDIALYNGLKTLDVEIPERDQFYGVKADYFDQGSSTNKTISIGKGPFARLPGRYVDAVQATNAAKAELSRIKRQSLKCSFSVPGNPEIMSEGLIVISGGDDRVNGDWSCDQAIHTWTTSGFDTSGKASAVIR